MLFMHKGFHIHDTTFTQLKKIQLQGSQTAMRKRFFFVAFYHLKRIIKISVLVIWRHLWLLAVTANVFQRHLYKPG